MTVRSDLEQRLGELPGLSRRRSRHGDGWSYFVGEREVAHFHGEERMDLRLTKDVIRQRSIEGRLDPRVSVRGPYAHWAAVRLVEVRDLALALDLVEEAVRSNG
jgi:hypothetical protein